MFGRFLVAFTRLLRETQIETVSLYRFNMIQAAVQDSDWLTAHPWEMSQDGFVDFGPTLHAIRFPFMHGLVTTRYKSVICVAWITPSSVNYWTAAMELPWAWWH